MVYFDYIFGIDSLLSCLYACLYSTYLNVLWVGGQHCVGVVLRHCLPTKTSYILGHVVDRECDILIESFVVHSLNVDLSRTWFHPLVVNLSLNYVIDMFHAYEYEIT